MPRETPAGHADVPGRVGATGEDERVPTAEDGGSDGQDQIEAAGGHEAPVLPGRGGRLPQPPRWPVHRDTSGSTTRWRTRPSSRSTTTGRCTGCREGAQPTEQVRNLLKDRAASGSGSRPTARSRPPSSRGRCEGGKRTAERGTRPKDAEAQRAAAAAAAAHRRRAGRGRLPRSARPRKPRRQQLRRDAAEVRRGTAEASPESIVAGSLVDEPDAVRVDGGDGTTRLVLRLRSPPTTSAR